MDASWYRKLKKGDIVYCAELDERGKIRVLSREITVAGPAYVGFKGSYGSPFKLEWRGWRPDAGSAVAFFKEQAKEHLEDAKAKLAEAEREVAGYWDGSIKKWGE